MIKMVHAQLWIALIVMNSFEGCASRIWVRGAYGRIPMRTIRSWYIGPGIYRRYIYRNIMLVKFETAGIFMPSSLLWEL